MPVGLEPIGNGNICEAPATTSSTGSDLLFDRVGSDTLQGGHGIDMAGYLTSFSVTSNSRPTSRPAQDENHTRSDVEDITGSIFGDS